MTSLQNPGLVSHFSVSTSNCDCDPQGPATIGGCALTKELHTGGEYAQTYRQMDRWIMYTSALCYVPIVYNYYQFEATGEIVVEGYTLDSDDIKVGGRVWCDDHTSSHHYPMYIPPTLLLPSVDLLLSAGMQLPLATMRPTQTVR